LDDGELEDERERKSTQSAVEKERMKSSVSRPRKGPPLLLLATSGKDDEGLV
jgi:hypothetical protein